jgi:tetratricopeptide (TPR) repeat protein
MKSTGVLALLLCTAPGLSCAAARDPGPRPLRPEEERAAAERFLRQMFPGIEGEISREAIAAELERERVLRDPSSGVRAAAREAIEKGDFDRARDLLGELLAGVHIDRARELTAAGDPRGALAALDRALEMAPHSASILCLRAEAALAVADLDRLPPLHESALSNFFEAASRDPVGNHGGDSGINGPGNCARAWLGASRAARALGRLEEALEFARRGIAALPVEAGAVSSEMPLRRRLAEASLDSYLGSRSAGTAAEVIDQHARESRDALEGLLGRAPEDAWPWERLAQLSQTQGSPTEARDLALRGLRLSPDDPELLERLSLAARELGGPRAAVAAFEPLCRRHPDVARAAWHLARARFDAAIEDSRALVDPRTALAAAERGFAHCRVLDEGLEGECRAFEAQCRGAAGFWLLAKGDLDAAHKAFLSMEYAAKGGLTQAVRGAKLRGTDGLYQVAEAYGVRGDTDNPESIDNLESAARICDLLHEAQPDEARFAAGAGRYNRDTAVAVELKAEALAGKGQAGQADRLFDRARELMEKAFRALGDAARLAPQDERIAAQAGTVLLRYLQRDPEPARCFLERAVDLGEAQVRLLAARAEEPGLPAAEREARRKLLEDEETLVGDACLDLGTLHLTLLGDPKRAREWLEKARQTGPDPRREIDGLLERCQAALEGKLDPRIRDENRWAAPVGPGRKP